jgi:hypothetical protein
MYNTVISAVGHLFAASWVLCLTVIQTWVKTGCHPVDTIEDITINLLIIPATLKSAPSHDHSSNQQSP